MEGAINGHNTMAVFKPLLDQWIVDIGQNLQMLQVQMHRRQSPLFRNLPALLLSRLIRKLGNAFPLLFNLSELLGAVGCEDLTCFLEALVGELLEGDVGGGLESGSASTGADWLDASGEKLPFFFASGDKVGVKGRGRGRWRERGGGSSSGFCRSFVIS